MPTSVQFDERYKLQNWCDVLTVVTKSKKFGSETTTCHCVKSVQMRSFFWSVFSRIRTEYGYGVFLRTQSECGKIRIRKNSVFRHFLRHSVLIVFKLLYECKQFLLKLYYFYYWCGFSKKKVVVGRDIYSGLDNTSTLISIVFFFFFFFFLSGIYTKVFYDFKV